MAIGSFGAMQVLERLELTECRVTYSLKCPSCCHVVIDIEGSSLVNVIMSRGILMLSSESFLNDVVVYSVL